jgi:hypothetical protein
VSASVYIGTRSGVAWRCWLEPGETERAAWLRECRRDGVSAGLLLRYSRSYGTRSVTP